ncbi:MAG: T9SS type A sorting domain-containing protein, partial [Bacteroidales bacterium]
KLISNTKIYLPADSYCADLSVDVVLDNPILCSDGNIYVSYINHGTATATNPTIDITLDDNLSYVSGGNLLSQDGNTLTFGLPDLEISESGQFIISAQYACDEELMGATACVDAHIYPDEPCEPVDSSWDHSSVMVEGECVGDSLICFTITNTGDPGDGDMAGTSDYRLFEDNVLIEEGTFQLNGGETMEMCWIATGTTLRLEADQRPGHPGNSNPQESIELCGSPENSTGQILAVGQDDADDFVETDCQEVLASYDPNDKAVVPTGITEEHHYIDTSDILEYKIRFQNTGTAPAQKVVIIDTISPHLDIESFHHMSASHECTIDFLYNNLVRWTFEDIMLPDSGSNEPASHGYVKFKIEQVPGNEYLTMITNGASIFFDYNLPVLTNEVYNTIGKMDDVFTDGALFDDNSKVKVYPNPAQHHINYFVDSESWKLEIYDATGRIIQRINKIRESEFRMSADHLKNGVYYYHISDKDGSITKGKLIINR